MPRILLLSTLATVLAVNGLISGGTAASVKNPLLAEGLGNIGCTFSKEVCDPNLEFCFNDNAFGRCLPLYETAEPAHLHRYSMSKNDFHLLEKELERLFAQGYHWGHAYTQCVLQSYLDAIRYGWNFERGSAACQEEPDQDLKGTLKDFSKNIDPWDLAFIKFAPSDGLEDEDDDESPKPHHHQRHDPPEFANEVYFPAAAAAGPGGEVVENLLQHSAAPSERQQFPPALDDKYLENLVQDYVLGDPLSKFIWNPAKKSSSPRQRPAEIPVAMPNLDALISDVDQLQRWNDGPAATGHVNENLGVAQVQPKIFTSSYNTPDSFRHGLETKDDLEFLIETPDATNQDAWQELELPNNLFNPLQNVDNSKRGYGYITDLDENDLDALFAAEDFLEKELREELAAQEVEEALGNREQSQNRPTVILEETEVGDEDLDNSIVPIPRRTSPLFTEGGVVFLNQYPKRVIFSDNEDPAEVEAELESAFSEQGTPDLKNRGFERRERLDVKKPGPWYRTVNNFAFDNDEPTAKQEPNSMKYGKFASKFTGKSPIPRSVDHGQKEGSGGHADHVKPARKITGEKTAGESPKEKQKEDIGDLMNLIKKAGSSAAAGKFVEAIPAFHQLDIIDTSYVNVHVANKIGVWNGARELVDLLADFLDLKHNTFREVRLQDNVVTFKVEPNDRGLNASEVAKRIETLIPDVQRESGIKIERAEVDLRTNSDLPEHHPLVAEEIKNKNIYIATFAVCGIVAAAIVAAFFIFLIRKSSVSRDKFSRLAQDDPNTEACKDYQELCRARMASKNNEKPETIRAVQRVQTGASRDSDGGGTSSSRSSTSSWTEEPVLTNMDISTGHMVLSYMEDHLKKKDRLDQEWASLCTYEADQRSTTIAEKTENTKKNRYTNSLPYDHARVVLNNLMNVGGADYINASTITDHDPRNPAYIATQGPLSSTAADFWQMVWEQGSVVIVTLTKLAENGTALCHRYWPEEGSELHHIYEVHLVSEHIWCDEYLVRSFYLKNLKTGETRTVTQFHFLAWPENGIPTSTKAILEFRRKVNKSYRGRSCPIIVHCSDGCGRTGTYCLIDLVLNRMAKGAKEIDIAASLEHVRDQRPGMVRTKQQFEFVLMAVAEEVHAILKAMPQ